MKLKILLLTLVVALVTAASAFAVAPSDPVGDGGGSGCTGPDNVTYAPGSIYNGYGPVGFYFWLGHPYSSLYYWEPFGYYRPTCAWNYYYGYPGWSHP